MHLRRPLAAVLPLVLALAAPAAAQPDVVSIVRRAGPAVVTLHAFNSTGREVSLGSGFFLPDGRIATNRHVVEGATRITVEGANERTLGSAQFAEAVGPTADLAILPRVSAPPATLTLASRLPEAGEAVVVIGAPEGLSNTVTTGIVSAIRRVQGRTLVQISAPISHGSSGGPVMNMRGEVIGVSVSVLSEGQNLNFAVPATELVALSRTPAQRIAFTGNLRGGVGSSTGASGDGADVSTQDLARLPRIAVGQTVSGRLADGDFVRPDGSYADSYVYSGRAGERITVTQRSRDFDAWVVVDDPRGPMQEYDDDGAGGTDSELTVTLPHDGQYLIVANSVAAQATGGYSILLRSAGRAPAEADGGSGGRGTLSDLARLRLPRITAGQTVSGRLGSGDFLRTDDNTFADGFQYTGRAGEQVTITMRATGFDAWLVLDDPASELREHDDDGAGGTDARLTVTLPHDGTYLVVANAVSRGSNGPYTLTLESGGRGTGGGNNPPPSGGARGTRVSLDDLRGMQLPAIANGQTVSGRLATGDYVREEDNTYTDAFFYTGRAGERITVTLRSSSFDAWLVVDDPNGPMMEHDDDSAGGTDAQLTVTLPHAGRYLILANSLREGATGAYTLTVRGAGAGSSKD